MLFRITVPRDVDMVPAIREVAERLAQCAGYTSDEARRVAACVGQAADAVIQRLSQARPDQQIDVTFEREGRHLDVWLRYRDVNAGQGPATVDPTLSREVLDQGMESVEFGNEDGVAFCRLRRLLPREKVDHQCEMPPNS